MSLYDTGVRPLIKEHLRKKAQEKRDYGDYWSASSAGYCMRLQIMRRLGVPKVPELKDDEDRQTRVFEAGHVFHEYYQRVTKESGASIAQEVELVDDDIMVKGHFDDLVAIHYDDDGEPTKFGGESYAKKLILYDYKTAHSGAFKWKQGRDMGHYHKMQLATYLYMIRKQGKEVNEARILTISKDDMREDEKQLLWTPALEKQVVEYWNTLNGYWKSKKLPRCTCADYDGGFMGKRSAKGKVYNDYFYEDEPCSLKWFTLMKKQSKIEGYNNGEANDNP